MFRNSVLFNYLRTAPIFLERVSQTPIVQPALASQQSFQQPSIENAPSTPATQQHNHSFLEGFYRGFLNSSASRAAFSTSSKTAKSQASSLKSEKTPASKPKQTAGAIIRDVNQSAMPNDHNQAAFFHEFIPYIAQLAELHPELTSVEAHGGTFPQVLFKNGINPFDFMDEASTQLAQNHLSLEFLLRGPVLNAMRACSPEIIHAYLDEFHRIFSKNNAYGIARDFDAQNNLAARQEVIDRFAQLKATDLLSGKKPHLTIQSEVSYSKNHPNEHIAKKMTDYLAADIAADIKALVTNGKTVDEAMAMLQPIQNRVGVKDYSGSLHPEDAKNIIASFVDQKDSVISKVAKILGQPLTPEQQQQLRDQVEGTVYTLHSHLTKESEGVNEAWEDACKTQRLSSHVHVSPFADIKSHHSAFDYFKKKFPEKTAMLEDLKTSISTALQPYMPFVFDKFKQPQAPECDGTAGGATQGTQEAASAIAQAKQIDPSQAANKLITLQDQIAKRFYANRVTPDQKNVTDLAVFILKHKKSFSKLDDYLDYVAQGHEELAPEIITLIRNIDPDLPVDPKIKAIAYRGSIKIGINQSYASEEKKLKEAMQTTRLRRAEVGFDTELDAKLAKLELELKQLEEDKKLLASNILQLGDLADVSTFREKLTAFLSTNKALSESQKDTIWNSYGPLDDQVKTPAQQSTLPSLNESRQKVDSYLSRMGTTASDEEKHQLTILYSMFDGDIFKNYALNKYHGAPGLTPPLFNENDNFKTGNPNDVQASHQESTKEYQKNLAHNLKNAELKLSPPPSPTSNDNTKVNYNYPELSKLVSNFGGAGHNETLNTELPKADPKTLLKNSKSQQITAPSNGKHW